MAPAIMRQLLAQGYDPESARQGADTFVNFGGFAGPGGNDGFDPQQFIQPSAQGPQGGQPAPPGSEPGNALAASPLAPKQPKPPMHTWKNPATGATISSPDINEFNRLVDEATPKTDPSLNDETNKADAARAANQYLAKWMQDPNNQAPQQHLLHPDALPVRDQVAVPEKQQAQLNPLASLLGLATMLGGQYGNPAQAAADQVHAAQQATQQNFQTDMEHYGAQADQAANKYHDALVAHNEGLKVQETNNAITDENALNQYKGRLGQATNQAQQVMADTLSAGKTRQQQQADNIASAQAAKKQAGTEDENYYKNSDTVSQIGARNDANARGNAAEAREEVKAPLDLEKLQQDIAAGRTSLKAAAQKLGIGAEELKQKIYDTNHQATVGALKETGLRLENEGKVQSNQNARTTGALNSLNVALKRIELAEKQDKEPDNDDIKTAMNMNDSQRDTALEAFKQADKAYNDAVGDRVGYYGKLDRDGNQVAVDEKGNLKQPKVYNMYATRERQAAAARNAAFAAYQHAETLHSANADALARHLKAPILGGAGGGQPGQAEGSGGAPLYSLSKH